MQKQKMKLPINWLVLAVSLSIFPACVSPRFQGLEPPPWSSSSSSQTSNVHSVNPTTTKVKTERPIAKGKYKVKSGDSLSKIALKYDLEFRKLAAANGIASPWIIYPGQILSLKEAPIPKQSKPVKSKPQNSQATNSQTSQNSVKPSKTTPQINSNQLKWSWPIKGTIVRAFGVGGVSNKGIDIQSSKAQSVMAAADGVVIFTGKGFGEGYLVIIQHSDSILTAYDNTRSIAVKEKQKIKVGQKIAELDMKGGVWQLHFEIRNNGKPVDPQKYLPALIRK